MALCCAAWSAFAGGPPNASQTAQDIMVSTNVDGAAYVINADTTWTFHRSDCAEAYYEFVNTWDGEAPAYQGCTGPGCEATPPSPPPAPSPNTFNASQQAAAIQNQAQGDKCIFFCGGDLGQDTYTKDASVTTGRGSTSATYTWRYTYIKVAPVDTMEHPSTVGEATCWTCSQTGGGTVDIDFSGFISSESFLKNNNTGTQKYSFTLMDNGNSRVLNVSAQLQYSTDGSLGSYSNVGSPISYGTLPVTSTVDDYTYYGNAGVFGNNAVYGSLHADGGGKPAALVSAILTNPPDNFAGNDNDLANGNVQEADFSGSFPGLSNAGYYQIVVTGSVKENSANGGAQNFTVTTSGTVIGGCPDCTPICVPSN